MQQWREWPEWTPEKEQRHRWLLHHIETCRECDPCREDNSSRECPALRAHLDAAAPVAAGGGS